MAKPETIPRNPGFEGMDAKRQGLTVDECPYEPGPQRTAWVAGWYITTTEDKPRPNEIAGLAAFTDKSQPGELYRDTSTGDLWHVIGWINSPAAIMVNRRTGERHVEIIGCRNAERFAAEGRIDL